MTRRQWNFSRATGAAIWRTSFSMWRVDAGTAKVESAHEQSCRLLFGPRRRDGAALYLPAAFVLAATTGDGLLACGANADLGLFANLSRPGARRRAEQCCPCGRRANRRGSP